jgi:serine-type D-Ala-D-Ala carboxypeptidase (penicillin-binding protein 5/6)
MTLPKPKKRKSIRLLILVAATMALSILLWPKGQHPVEARQTTPAAKPAYAVTPNWPTNAAAAAVGVQGAGVLASTNDQKPRPIASIAKVITALAILEKHPLKDDEFGPSIPITEADEQLYRDYVAKNGTVVLVKSGVPLTERDALEAMLLPSANNVADTTAKWAFGSLSNYRKYANDMLRRHGLANTTIGIDASGLDPSTTSTASDLVRIGELALKNPVISQIVALPAAYIPYAGDIPNYNSMVTKHGYTGIKPGESVQAGNTLLFSTKETIAGKPMTIIGAVLGTEGYSQSNAAALQIVESVKSTIKPNTDR